MSLTTTQIEAITVMMDEYIEKERPPVEIRKKIDIGWKLERQSVYIFEVRPGINDTGINYLFDYAKATWVKTEKHWKIFWKRASGKWNVYDPLPEAGNLQLFLLEVDKDPHHCFKG